VDYGRPNRRIAKKIGVGRQYSAVKGIHSQQRATRLARFPIRKIQSHTKLVVKLFELVIPEMRA
jgi:hypothetical protein